VNGRGEQLRADQSTESHPTWTDVRRHANSHGPMHLLSAFYAAMAAIALYGQSDGLMVWLRAPRLVALAGAFSVELLAAVLFAFADWRRTHRAEHAFAARLLSVAVALGVAAMNFYGHEGNTGRCALFVGSSLAGYAVWVLHTNARRRDALRAEGKLAPASPSYGLWEWTCHPLMTRRARSIATGDPALGLHDSLHAARAEQAAERRRAAVTSAVRRKLAAGLDPVSAQLAIQSYDLDRIAADLAGRIEYGRLVDLLAADLHPDRLATGSNHADRRTSHRRPGTDAGSAGSDPDTAADTGSTSRRPHPRTPRRDTASAVARLRVRHPDMPAADIARRLGVTDRTVRRHLAAQHTHQSVPA
jgi:hypothetical protein